MIKKISKLLSDCDKEGVTYCNWKSNNKIKQSVEAEIDIELLCHQNDKAKIERLLKKHNYKRFDDVPLADYPGITNYIGYDEKSGKLIHIHLHYELTFGKPYLKEYVSPWASYVLDKRIRDKKTNVWISDPAVELFLLLVRFSLKIRRWNVLSRRAIYNSFLDEYEWLCMQTNADSVGEVCQDLLSSKAVKHIIKMVREQPKFSQFHRLRSIVRSELQVYNTHRRSTTAVLPLLRKAFRGVGKLNEISLQRPFPTRRTAATNGFEVGFIGIDGSGKSTYSHEIHKWLSWKVQTRSIYLGSGNGRSSMARYPLKKINQLKGRKINISKNASQKKFKKPSEEFQGNLTEDMTDDVGLSKAIWSILLAKEKRKKRQKSRKARNRGSIVVIDRYPQNQYPGQNDGPLLSSWKQSNSAVLSWVANWENEIYKNLHESPPDLLIKLETSPEIAKQRKPETPIWELRKKAEIIDSLTFNNCKVITINTEKDMNQVLKEIKSEIWREI